MTNLTQEQTSEILRNFSGAVQDITQTYMDKGLTPVLLRSGLNSLVRALDDIHTASLVASILADAGIKPLIQDPTQT